MAFTIVRNDTNEILTQDCYWVNRDSSKDIKLFRDSRSASKVRSALNCVGGFNKGVLVIEYYNASRILKIDAKEFLDVIMKNRDKDIILCDWFDCDYGYKLNCRSSRYLTFIKKGVKCVDCGMEGKYIWIEKNGNGDHRYHGNMYGIDGNGIEVMFTKDHIHPKSKGGRSNIKNYQTMCSRCNGRKSNNVE